MELIETVNDMTSADYKNRFRAEYNQLKIRFEKLKKTIDDYYDGKLKFELACPIEDLEDQLFYMERYMWCLEERARIEDIEL